MASLFSNLLASVTNRFRSLFIATPEDEMKIKIEKSRDRIRALARQAIAPDPERDILSQDDIDYTDTMSPSLIGKLVFFKYEAITPNIFYDMFPMVFPISVEYPTFIGYNFHHLDILTRAYVLDNMFPLAATTEYLPDGSKFNMSYETVKNSPHLMDLPGCLRKYRLDKIQSPIAIIPPSEWDIALFLPLERMVYSRGK
jgi:hypothetical protein